MTWHELSPLSSNDDGYRLSRQRRAALAEVDKASFSWSHFKVCMVASAGFFTSSYDMFAIDIAATMLGYLHHNGKHLALPSTQDFALKVATPCGTLVGQLVFGWLADNLGRKRMYGVELMIIMVATFCQATAGEGRGLSLIGVLVVWRVVMGIGIGGDHPLSAVVSSEYAPTRTRGRVMTAVFSSQGWGNFFSGICGLAIVSAFRDRFMSDPDGHLVYVDHMWRWLIGIGCVPCAVALCFRLTLPETPRFTMDVERNVQQAYSDVQAFLGTGDYRVGPDTTIYRARRVSSPSFISYFSRWNNFKALLGTSYSWFALDISFYGLGLHTATVLEAIGMIGEVQAPPGTRLYSHEIYAAVQKACIGQILLSIAGLIPGFWFSFACIDSRGRKPIQLMGFVVLTVIFLIMGCAYETLTMKPHKFFFVLYCLANFFFNFGPNVTTFVIPGELFPTRYCSTAHGIRASGKLGAIIAQVVFWRLYPNQSTSQGGAQRLPKKFGVLLMVFAAFMLSGCLSTLLVPETRGKSLEVLSRDDQGNFYAGFADGGPPLL